MCTYNVPNYIVLLSEKLFNLPYNKVSSTLNWTGFLSVFSRHDDDLVVVSEELFVIF